MGAHTWHAEPVSDAPIFEDVSRELLERMDLLAAELDGRHGCLDAPVD